VGVRRLLDLLKEAPVKPRLCIVGEPTLMQAVTAHKGKLGFRVTAHGLEAHSSLAPIGVNAIYMASDLIGAIRAIQAEIAEHGMRDGDYEVAYTTLHVGKMQGGEVMNIVPNRATSISRSATCRRRTSTPSSPASRRRRRRSQRAIAAFSTRRVSISRSCRATRR
jgi:acetylornithine deacetylase/succinyl-diaminopimelate desuccinylase-like protein